MQKPLLGTYLVGTTNTAALTCPSFHSLDRPVPRPPVKRFSRQVRLGVGAPHAVVHIWPEAAGCDHLQYNEVQCTERSTVQYGLALVRPMRWYMSGRKPRAAAMQ